MNKLYNTLLFVALIIHSASGQLPETDIWLFKIKYEKSKPPALGEGKNFTNRKGYDNQPSFSPNGKEIYFSSVGNNKQSDIYIYTTSNKKTRALTSTADSEYSLLQLKKDDNFSSVTVEKDSAQ